MSDHTRAKSWNELNRCYLGMQWEESTSYVLLHHDQVFRPWCFLYLSHLDPSKESLLYP